MIRHANTEYKIKHYMHIFFFLKIVQNFHIYLPKKIHPARSKTAQSPFPIPQSSDHCGKSVEPFVLGQEQKLPRLHRNVGMAEYHCHLQ